MNNPIFEVIVGNIGTASWSSWQEDVANGDTRRAVYRQYPSDSPLKAEARNR
jgi:hypothetical protein